MNCLQRNCYAFGYLIAVQRIMQIFAQKGGRRKRAAFELNNYFELSN